LKKRALAERSEREPSLADRYSEATFDSKLLLMLHESKENHFYGLMKLYVGNLSFQTSSEDLQQTFCPGGTVESATVVEDRDTGRSRGFGFVEMASNEEVRKQLSSSTALTLTVDNLTVN